MMSRFFRSAIIFHICCSTFLSFYFRTVETPLDLKGLYGADPPRHLYMAKVILKEGRLPPQDMLREYPIGRKTSTQLTLFPYVLAYLYKLTKFLHIPLSLEQVAILSPVLFYLLSATAASLIAWRIYGLFTALITFNLLGFLPPLIGRTMAGFADRDSFVLFLSLLSLPFYILRCHQDRFWKTAFYTFLSSLFMILLGLTWPGVGIFVVIITTIELVKLIIKRRYDLHDLALLLIWSVPLCITLPLLKETYRLWSKPYVIPAIWYPALAALSGGFNFLLRSLRKPLPSSLISVSTLTALGSIVILSSSPGEAVKLLKNITSPFGSNPLAGVISELQKMGALSWAMWPGIFFIFTLAGMLISIWRASLRMGINPWYASLSAELPFFGMAFSRIFSGIDLSSRETPLTIGILWGTLALGAMGFTALILVRSFKKDSGDQPSGFEPDLLMAIWAVVTLLCMRSAVRFAYLFAVPGAILGSGAIVEGLKRCVGSMRMSWFTWLLLILLSWQIYSVLCANRSLPSPSCSVAIYILLAVISSAFLILHMRRIPRWTRRVGFTLLSLYLIGLTSMAPSAWLGGYGLNYKLSIAGRKSFAEELDLEGALEWLRRNTPPSAVVAASWEYGSWINLLAERATVVDEQQNPYRVYLISRLVLAGRDEREALRLLKTYRATHLLITRRDISLLKAFSKQGMTDPVEIPFFGFAVEAIKTEGFEKEWEPFYRYLPRVKPVYLDEPLVLNGERYEPGEWAVESVYLAPHPDRLHALVEVILRGKPHRLPPREVILQGKVYRSASPSSFPCTLLIYAPSDKPESWSVFYLSPRARETISVRLFMLHELNEHFRLVYPPPGSQGDFSVQIWEIVYPKDIEPKPEYLSEHPIEGYGDWISIP